MAAVISTVNSSGASTAQSPPSTTAAVVEYLCLFTHDLKRKQKRWQDGRLKYHTFNKRVMVYDERGNNVGDAHWRPTMPSTKEKSWRWSEAALSCRYPSTWAARSRPLRAGRQANSGESRTSPERRFSDTNACPSSHCGASSAARPLSSPTSTAPSSDRHTDRPPRQDCCPKRLAL